MNEAQAIPQPAAVENPELATWRARAIYEGPGHRLDILPDRQSAQGEEQHRVALCNWLNMRALPEMNKMIAEKRIPTNSNEHVTIREFTFELTGTPNGSYGYFYLTARLVEPAKAAPYHNTTSGLNEQIFLIGKKKLVWGPPGMPPAPGTNGAISVNEIGSGTVVGYQDEPYAMNDYRLLDLLVKLDNPPQWWLDQTYHAYRYQQKQAHRDVTPRDEWTPPPAIIWGEDFKVMQEEN